MAHQLPDLPFAKDALAPLISAETIDFHYGRHHLGYIKKLNNLIKGTEFENLSLEETFLQSSGPVFNNAAQAWNHNFMWKCLIPADRYREPQGPLAAAIREQFSSLDHFDEQFVKTAEGVFGSGWVWLVANDIDGTLSIETTHNGDNPLLKGKLPLLTLDVWEHAYYIDYRNERPRYAKALLGLLNWQFAEEAFLQKTEVAA